MGGGGGRGKGCMNGERLGFEVMLVVVVLVQGHWLWADRQALLLQLLQAAALLSCTLLHEPSLLQLQPQPLPLLASRKGMPGHPMAEHQRRQRVHYARFPYAHSKAHERAQEGQELLQQGSGQESACAVHRHKRKVALASTAAAAAAAAATARNHFLILLLLLLLHSLCATQRSGKLLVTKAEPKPQPLLHLLPLLPLLAPQRLHRRLQLLLLRLLQSRCLSAMLQQHLPPLLLQLLPRELPLLVLLLVLVLLEPGLFCQVCVSQARSFRSMLPLLPSEDLLLLRALPLLRLLLCLLL